MAIWLVLVPMVVVKDGPYSIFVGLRVLHPHRYEAALDPSPLHIDWVISWLGLRHLLAPGW